LFRRLTKAQARVYDNAFLRDASRPSAGNARPQTGDNVSHEILVGDIPIMTPHLIASGWGCPIMHDYDRTTSLCHHGSHGRIALESPDIIHQMGTCSEGSLGYLRLPRIHRDRGARERLSNSPDGRDNPADLGAG